MSSRLKTAWLPVWLVGAEAAVLAGACAGGWGGGGGGLSRTGVLTPGERRGAARLMNVPGDHAVPGASCMSAPRAFCSPLPRASSLRGDPTQISGHSSAARGICGRFLQ